MRSCCVRLLAFCLLVLSAALASGPGRAADITVFLDEARLVKMPERAATLVIGNPSIADAAVQSGGWLVVTGKGYGSTNVIALDRGGAVLMEKTIEVQGPRDVVVVYRGMDRATYSCTPDCERRLTLGDSQNVFEQTSGQITARNGLAAGTPNR
jgi:Flp pilus assembly secretin CpaC